MLRIPAFLSERGTKKGLGGARTNASSLSEGERMVHDCIVRRMAPVNDPITDELIADELKVAKNKVHKIADKLENLKTFIY